MFPGGDVFVFVDGALEAVVGRGTIEIVLHVVFAGPQDHHRLVGELLGDLRGFHDEIGLIAASECAAHQRGVHDYGFVRKLGDAGDDVLRPLRGLRGDPGFGTIGADLDGAVHRLHAGVGGEGEFVDGFDFLVG